MFYYYYYCYYYFGKYLTLRHSVRRLLLGSTRVTSSNLFEEVPVMLHSSVLARAIIPDLLAQCNPNAVRQQRTNIYTFKREQCKVIFNIFHFYFMYMVYISPQTAP